MGHNDSRDRNSGNRNSGNWNSGYWNSGDWNSGDSNSGDSNSGNSNSGNWNSGDRNSGHWNSGDSNSGNSNSGNWNSGDRNSGFFCTKKPSPTFFDKPFNGTWDEAYELIPYVELFVGTQWVCNTKMTDNEKAANPSHDTCGGYLKVLHKSIKDTFPVAWSKMDDEMKERFLNLPNFNAEKFLQITGVDVRACVPVVPSEIVVEGRVYRLAE